jgi:hypothetical protein
MKTIIHLNQKQINELLKIINKDKEIRNAIIILLLSILDIIVVMNIFDISKSIIYDKINKYKKYGIIRKAEIAYFLYFCNITLFCNGSCCFLFYSETKRISCVFLEYLLYFIPSTLLQSDYANCR